MGLLTKLDEEAMFPATGGMVNVERRDDALERIWNEPPGLHFVPRSTTLPNIWDEHEYRRLHAEYTIINGELCLRRDGQEIPIEQRIGKGAKILALTGPSGIGKTTLATHLMRALGPKCRTIRSYTTRERRRGETNSPFLSFLTRLQMEEMYQQDEKSWPRLIAMLYRFAYEDYLTRYPQMRYALAHSDWIVMACHADKAIKLKRSGLYSMHICYLGPRRLIAANERNLEYELGITVPERNRVGWRHSHKVLMSGLARAAITGHIEPLIDSVLVTDCFDERRLVSHWSPRQIDEAVDQFLGIFEAMEGRPRNQEYARAFTYWSYLQEAIPEFIEKNEAVIEELLKLDTCLEPELDPLHSLSNTLQLLDEYALLGPGSPRPFPR